MITLYTFGPHFGLPDPSPFVTKTEIHLKMAGLPYRTDTTGFNKAPKGKLPYINDNGKIIADSSLIRIHLEQRHGVDFDKTLSNEQRAAMWSVEKMCEEHLYWAIVRSRWVEDQNFDKGPRVFFDRAPAPIRPIVIRAVRRGVRKAMRGQGLGRHTPDELDMLAARDIDALAVLLGAKPWFGGDEPCGADASIWAHVANALCPHFDGALRTNSERHANLQAYARRGFDRWFPQLKPVSA